MERHRRLDYDLDALRDRVLLLGGATEKAVQRSMQALSQRDSVLARRVLDGDDAIDALEVEIDRLGIDILALRQPAARDLRFVVAVAKITPILERIADHACNIARAALELNDEPEIPTHSDLSLMGARAFDMLHATLDAFTGQDAPAARAIIAQDDEVDRIYERLFGDLLALMTAYPETIRRATRLLMVAKHIERIADYVTDICELTVYLSEALVIKHQEGHGRRLVSKH